LASPKVRVYELARELDIKSGAIVKKCQDEGLDVKNHMSAISAGLAATIREWFSEGENVTTVESSSKVDLEKVRAKRRRKAREKEKAARAEAEAQAQAELEQSQAESTSVVEQVQPEQEVADAKEAETAEKPSEAAEITEEVEKPKKTEDKETEQKPQEPEKPEEKPKPERIIPAGPMLEKPKPATLSGPEVIRVEKPEPERPRRPRPAARPPRRRKYDEPVTEPLVDAGTAPTNIVQAPPKGGKKGKGKKDKGRKGGAFEEAPIKKPKIAKLRKRDIEERQARLQAASGAGLRAKPSRKIESKSKEKAETPTVRPEKVTINEPIHVKDLSAALAVKASDIIGKLMQQGVMANINQAISTEVAELVALEFGTELEVVRSKSLEEQINEEFDNRPRNNMTRRAPIVTMLGHVDHGKTSLLDKVRKTEVTATEHGGITQHIGAYQVTIKGHTVTFLDTPGHEAFTAMRARGANMTDIVVLVVAADDGLMQQTIEAIHHAKAAGVKIIVALNKCDLPGMDYNRIYAQLAEHELTPIEWGGDTDVIKTSAVTGEGVEDLLEHLDFAAELLEMQADNTIPATGWVVEAQMSTTRGPVATLLVKEGKIKTGDVVLAGRAYGRVKTLRESSGKTVKSAHSAMPVEVTGLNDVADAGDRFYVLEDINRAKTAAEEKEHREREDKLAKRTQVTLDNLFSQIEAGSVKELNVIIRADVQGSVDVLNDYLNDLSTDEVKVRILHSAPGGITEGDVVLAEASNAIIIGFNVVPESQVEKLAEEKGVEIRLYNIIYQITEELKKAMAGMLEPEEKEKQLGKAVVRETFKVSRLGTIAGCHVTEGVARKDAKARLVRDNIVIRDNLTLESLKRFKDDAREVRAGYECGVKLRKYDDVKIDDTIIFYTIEKVARTLD